MDVVSEILGWHYSHSNLDALFRECGAAGEPPVRNKVDKCYAWFKRINDDPRADPLQILGRLPETYMDYKIPKSSLNIHEWGGESPFLAL